MEAFDPAASERTIRVAAGHEEFAAELAVVARLRRYADATGPDRATRDRILERILDAGAVSGDISPRPRQKPAGPKPGPAKRGRRKPGAHARPRSTPRAIRAAHRPSGARGRLAVTALAVFAVLIAVSGLSVLLAKNALPGDSLYRFKRITESAAVGLTFDSAARARKHLEYASDRVRDIDALRDAPAVTPHAYRLAFDDFDGDAAAGSRGLTALGTAPAAAKALTSLRNWAVDEYTQLVGLHDELPAAVRHRATISTELLSRIAKRADLLQARLRCDTVTSGASDRLGLLPATNTCDATTPASGATQSPPADDRDRHQSSTTRTAETTKPPIAVQPPSGSMSKPPGMRGTQPSTNSSTARSRQPSPSGAGNGGRGLRLPLPIDLPPLPPVPPLLGLPGTFVN